jgi:hypothetical protein
LGLMMSSEGGLVKLCKGCGEIKSLDNFNIASNRPDGRQDRCRDCQREYYLQNKERLRAKGRQWYQRNLVRKKAQNAQWSRKNKERHKELKRLWYERNRDHHLSKTRERISANREHHRRLVREWNRRNPEKRRVACQLRRDRIVKAQGQFSVPHVRAKLELQGGLCYYCGASLSDGYHIDHKIPLNLGGSNWPANICCACSQCNLSKGGKSFWEFMMTLA